jgi:DNA-binding MarR family transcriptional regulator
MRPEETVCFNIKSSWHAISKMYNMLGLDHELSSAVGFVLLNIDPKEGTPATKIAPIMGMEAGSLSRILKNLEEKKWIKRVADKQDKRMVRIVLTDLGQEKRELSKKVVVYFNLFVREEIGEEKLKIFFEVIDKVSNVAKDQKQMLINNLAKFDNVK